MANTGQAPAAINIF